MKKASHIKFFIAFLFLFSTISAQTGGTFEITQSVIAGGGQPLAGGAFSLDGTTGQAIAGDELSNEPFVVTSGFWNYSPLPVTAANATVSGRVLTQSGNGIRNALVTISATNGTMQTTFTGSFGYFKFEGVAVGETYFISVLSRRFTFTQPTQVRSVFEDVADINFIADEQ